MAHADDATRAELMERMRTIPGYRTLLKERLSTARHEEIDADISAHIGVCVGCGGDLAPWRFTKDCAHCRDRSLRMRARRARSNGDASG